MSGWAIAPQMKQLRLISEGMISKPLQKRIVPATAPSAKDPVTPRLFSPAIVKTTKERLKLTPPVNFN
jgi:hypothetical protein